VSSGVAPATRVGTEASVGSAVEIEERWLVHARAPGSHGEPLAGPPSAIAEWRPERRLDASVRVAGRPIGSRR
jgi:hypothetical protein